jgi:hypothetical protein
VKLQRHGGGERRFERVSTAGSHDIRRVRHGEGRTREPDEGIRGRVSGWGRDDGRGRIGCGDGRRD